MYQLSESISPCLIWFFVLHRQHDYSGFMYINFRELRQSIVIQLLLALGRGLVRGPFNPLHQIYKAILDATIISGKHERRKSVDLEEFYELLYRDSSRGVLIRATKRQL